MTATLLPWTPEPGPWNPENMRSEPLDEAGHRLDVLAADIDRTDGRVRLTRPGRPDLILMPLAELESLEETVFWQDDALERAADGEPVGAGEEGPGLDEAGARALHQELLLRRDRAAPDRYHLDLRPRAIRQLSGSRGLPVGTALAVLEFVDRRATTGGEHH